VPEGISVHVVGLGNNNEHVYRILFEYFDNIIMGPKPSKIGRTG
jgi:hypothetical protein